QQEQASQLGLTPAPDPKEAWIESLRRLQQDIREIDPLLRIYAAEAHKHVAVWAATDPGGDAEVEEFFPDADAFCESLGIDIEAGTINPEFKIVLDKLDAFIKENFKPEEVFAVLPRN